MHNILRLLRPLVTFISAAFFILLGFIAGAALKAALTWVDPVGAPPALNAPAPINVSDVTQTKGGGLNIATISGRFGIATQSPQARLHLETTGLTATDYGFRMGGNGQFVIDAPGVLGGRLTVLENGNVGIGNNNPDAKLRIDGQVKIVDGSQGAGKLLTSDANGLASWRQPASTACPVGFSDASSYCISSSEVPATSWFSAINVCKQQYGAQLCSASQWIAACQNNLLGATATGGWEWVDDLQNFNASTIVGFSSCTDVSALTPSGGVNFRCCVPKISL